MTRSAAMMPVRSINDVEVDVSASRSMRSQIISLMMATLFSEAICLGEQNLIFVAEHNPLPSLVDRYHMCDTICVR